MQEFNIGDKVKYTGEDFMGLYIDTKEVYTVSSCNAGYLKLKEIIYSHSYKVENFVHVEVKEEPKQMFNIKTDPWFIRVNSEQEFEAIQDWLQENYGCSLIASYNTAFEYLTNTSCTGQIEEAFVMHGRGYPLETTSRKEIKLTFKTIIDSVTFPEVESEHQIKMKQLQETIDKAARELKELREMGEKK